MKKGIFFVALLLFANTCLFGQSLCKESTLKNNWNLYDYVVVGKIISVEPSAKSWSGIIWVDQKVNYKVERKLKGEINEDAIIVSHYVVENSLTADKEFPQLSPTLFKKENSLVLFLKKKSIKKDNKIQVIYESEDANCGALTAIDAVINLITSKSN